MSGGGGAAPGKLDRVVALAGLGTLEWRVEEGWVQGDARYGELLGHGSVEIRQRFSRFLEQVHPEQRSMVRAGLLGLRTGRSSRWEMDLRVQTASHAYKWLNLVAGARFESDEGTLITGVVGDISDRKQVEAELVHREANLASLIYAIPGAVYQCTYDRVWNTLFLSEHFEEISGYPVSEFLDQRISFKSLVEESDLPIIQRAVRDSLEKGGAYSVDFRIKTKSGDVRWIHDEGRSIRDPYTGAVQHLYGVMTDVTKQRAQSDRLELLQAVVENANDGVLVTEAEPFDRPGPRIVYANQAICQLTGYTLEEMLGQSPRLFQGPESPREPLDRIRESLDRWEPVRVEVMNYRKDGTTYWSELSVVPLADRDGWYTHWVSVQRDISLKKASETLLRQRTEELQRAKETAERATEAKSRFLATMSHEIRTPINGVIGMTSVLRDTSLTDEQRDYLDTIQMSGETLLALINDILDFSKIEAGSIDLEGQPFDLRSAVEDALELVAPKAQGKGLRLGYWADSSVPRRFRGDVTRFRQIVINLVGNAVKFTDRGEVKVVLKMEGALLRVEVRDSGVGIDPAQMSQLFKPFTQADASITRRFGGTGLGLAICRELVTLMGGEIGVDSEPGQGSTFWFTVSLEPVNAPCLGGLEVEAQRVLSEKKVRLDLKWPLAAKFLSLLIARMGAVIVGEDEEVDVLISDRDIDVPPPSQLVRVELDCPKSEAVHGEMKLRLPLREGQTLRRLLEALGHVPSEAAPVETEFREQDALTDLRVLLVEDNPINTEVALAMLHRWGLTAEVAANGQEALDRVSNDTYDLVLMDMQMPVMDGLTATRRIRASENEVHQPYIVALTANALDGDENECLEAGMNDFLSKPIRPRDLLTSLGRASNAARSGPESA